MIPIKERLTVVGRTTAGSKILHAVVIVRTTDRDGVRYTEPGVRSLCEQRIRVLEVDQDADAVILHGASRTRCRSCRSALFFSAAARRVREEREGNPEQFRKNAGELC